MRQLYAHCVCPPKLTFPTFPSTCRQHLAMTAEWLVPWMVIQRRRLFVVGKNYRLQDIQLSKSSTIGPWGRGATASPEVTCPEKSCAEPAPADRGRPWPTWLARRAETAPMSVRRRLVENTGLEPVTSWLQTRRSPS
jgi:hypothetical protein